MHMYIKEMNMQINLLGSKVRNPEQWVTRQSLCMDMFCWTCSTCMVGPHARDSLTTGGSGGIIFCRQTFWWHFVLFVHHVFGFTLLQFWIGFSCNVFLLPSCLSSLECTSNLTQLGRSIFCSPLFCALKFSHHFACFLLTASGEFSEAFQDCYLLGFKLRPGKLITLHR